jgi:hypothetical protein
MRRLSTRTLSALAYERGEEYDPSLPPVSPVEMDALVLCERAQAIVGEAGAYERARQARRRRRREQRELRARPRVAFG